MASSGYSERGLGATRWCSCAVLLAVLAMVVLTACGEANGGAAEGPSQSKAGGKPEAKSVTVGVIPAAAFAPIYIGIQDGYFEREGIKVKAKTVESGPAAVAGTVSGDLDVASTNYFSVISSARQRLPLRIVAEGQREKTGQVTVQALPNSSIRKPEDLVGKKVAVNSLKNNGDIGTSAVLDDLGIDYRKVKFVEVPFGDMGPALQKGTVDAVWTPEPVRTLIRQTLKSRDVLDYATGPLRDFPDNGYVANSKWADENKNTLAAFQCGLEKAVRRAQKDPASVRKVLPEYTTLPKAFVRKLPLPRYQAGIELDAIQRNADLMRDQKLIDKPFKMDSITTRPPSDCG